VLNDAASRLSAAIDHAATQALATARDQLDQAIAESRATPDHVPLGQIRPNAALIDEECKLVTHAIRMAAYNAQSTLTRMIRPHYTRAEYEARASSAKPCLSPDPASAPRRSCTLAA
jgi:hypothetical protein